MKKLILETVCSACHHPLNDGEWIVLKLRLPGKGEGTISLSAYFSDYSVKLPFFIEEGVLGSFSCPHCSATLNTNKHCQVCQAPLFTLGIKTGGIIDVCTRKGCKAHALGGFGDPDEMMALINKLVDTPYL